MNFSQFDFDFDFFSMSDFKATETQFKPEPIDLFKKYNQFCIYTASLAVLVDFLIFLQCQNCITFKIVYK